MSLPLHDFYRFDEFELSRSRRALLRDGALVPLLPKTFEVLSCLVRNPGRVLAKEEILRTVWPESFVEENNLTQHISLLRKALADRSTYIVTIPGRGYQFTATVVLENGLARVPNAGIDTRIAENGVPNGKGLHIARVATPLVESAAAPTSPKPTQQAAIPLRRRNIPLWASLSAAAGLLAAVSLAGIFFWTRWAHPPQLHSVMVADFLNSTGDATFDHTLKRALEIDLEQSPYINVMSEREATGTLALMGRARDAAITGDLAREICERSNRQVLLVGTIQPIGHEYLLTLEAAECATGRKLTAAKAEAAAKEKVLAALDTVADRVRRGLGESTQSLESYQVPIMQATTASLDALRSYSIGQSLDAQGKSENEILPFYQRAVALDPQFAMAYGAMANEFYNLSEPTLASEFYKKAFELSDRVSARERLILEAHYYSEGLRDMEQGINTYRQWAATYPNDWVPWVDLANDYTQLGEYAPAIAAARQALKIQPDRAINYSVLVRALKRANQLAEAQTVAAEAQRRGKDSAGLHASLFEIAAANRNANALAQEMQWAANNSNGWYGWYFLFLRGEAAAAAGKHKQADDLFRNAWEVAERQRLEEAADHILIYQATVELGFGLPAHSRVTLSHTRNADFHSPDFAIARAQLGDSSLAERFISTSSGDPHPGTIPANVDLPRVRATLAMAKGKPLDAVAALEPARPYEMASYTVPNQRAEAWLKAGHPEFAVSEYQKILTNQGVDPLSPLYPMAHLGIARAYSRQNKIAESRSEYEHFFALWKEADTDLPLLAQARAEYARLTKPAPLPSR
ncbi:MAG TPA: winged helix-turn-helix domain-containing protein [Terracidiphilus sp.]|nr:winged helix-turn-helix domain-containing protein [Terracidiphilus sp.]